MTDVVHKNGKILKHCELVKLKDAPKYAINAWKKPITKINYDVGDECVFEITKGDKRWTISLDDFFDKVIQICGKEKQDD